MLTQIQINEAQRNDYNIQTTILTIFKRKKFNIFLNVCT